MDLNQLQNVGGFVDLTPVRKSITWTRTGSDGKTLTDTFDVFVVQQSFGAMEKALDGINDDRLRMSKLISMCVRLGDNGEQELTQEQAGRLTSSLGTLLANAVNEVMGFSAPKT